jgi:hypothetical protein
LRSDMFFSSRSAAVDLRWCRRTGLMAVLLLILSCLRGRSRAAADSCATNQALKCAPRPGRSACLLSLLIDVSQWSLAAGDAAFRPRPIRRPRFSARLKTGLSPAQLGCADSVLGGGGGRFHVGTRPRSRGSRSSVFIEITFYREHNPAFRSVCCSVGGVTCSGQFELS